jgi:hypothetical protein
VSTKPLRGCMALPRPQCIKATSRYCHTALSVEEEGLGSYRTRDKLKGRPSTQRNNNKEFVRLMRASDEFQQMTDDSSGRRPVD